MLLVASIFSWLDGTPSASSSSSESSKGSISTSDSSLSHSDPIVSSSLLITSKQNHNEQKNAHEKKRKNRSNDPKNGKLSRTKIFIQKIEKIFFGDLRSHSFSLVIVHQTPARIRKKKKKVVNFLFFYVAYPEYIRDNGIKG